MRRAFAGLGVVAVAAVALFVLLVHNPLVAGSSGGGGDPRYLVTDESGNYFRYVPGTDYYELTSIRNDGLAPVTIRGPHLDETTGPGPYVVELLHGGGPHEGGMNDYAEAEPFTGSDLAPNEEIWVWVHWRTGPCLDGQPPYGPGSGATAEDIRVDWSILGVPRTSWVGLAAPFDIRNIDVDPHYTCAAQPS